MAISNKQIRHVVVIGARGYIGNFLLTKLSILNVEVTSFNSGMGGIDLHSGIFKSKLNFPLDVDTVIFLSQSPFYRDLPAKQAHLHAVNTVSALQAAQACIEAGIKHFFYASSGTVYQSSDSACKESAPLNWSNGYALSKIHAEQALATYSKYLNITIGRIFTVYGPLQSGKLIPNLLESIKSSRPISLMGIRDSDGFVQGMRLSLIHIDDLTDSIIKLLNHVADDEMGYKIVNIASPESLSIREIALSLADGLGKVPLLNENANLTQTNLTADTTYLKSLISKTWLPTALELNALASNAK
jgi:nucleoside-diphosphate-sugar epimerase